MKRWRILGLTAAMAVSAAATQVTYTNTTSTDWQTAANWSPIGVPPFNVVNANLRLNVNGTLDYTANEGATTLDIAASAGENRSIVIGASANSANGALRVLGGTLKGTQEGTTASVLIGAGQDGGYAGTATLTVAGGTFDAAGCEIGILSRGAAAAACTFQMDSGTAVADIVSFGVLASSSGSGTLRLNGGTLTVRTILDRNACANSLVQFNGGTLVAGDTNNDEEWIRDDNGGVAAQILAGGALFDTAGQGNQRIAVSLLDGTGGGTDGGLTKNGAGTLVLLGGGSDYHGATTVNQGTLQVGAGGTVGVVSPNSAVSVAGDAVLAVNRSDTVSQSTLMGALSGAGTIEQKGPGVLVLDTANSNVGTNLVSAGILRVAHAGGLGTVAGRTVVADTARLELAGGVTVCGETLAIAGDGGTPYFGALQSQSGINTWAGPVILNGGTGAGGARMGAQNGATLIVSGAIQDGVSASPVIRNETGGVTEFSGANTYSGDTALFHGTLRMGAANTLPAATVARLGYNTLNGTLDLNGHSQRVSGIAVGSGATDASQTILNNGSVAAVLTVSNTAAHSFGGILRDGTTDSLALVKDGSGTLTLTGENVYSGGTTILDGALLVNNAAGSGSGSGAVTVTGGTLGGTGCIAGLITMSSGSTLAPGASPGTLRVLSDLAFASDATFRAELWTNGADLVQMNLGGLNLGGSMLAVDDQVEFAPLTVFTILENYGTLTGRFSGLPDSGDQLSGVNNIFEINYGGGDGNDITLTVIPEPAALGALGVLTVVLLLRRRRR